MPTSTSTIFCRVNRRRPCRICGKPDWCSFTRGDERISICMRVSEGARRVNWQGGAIFIHEDRHEEALIDVREVAKVAQSPVAPIALRDFVYGRLLHLSPAGLHRGTLIAGDAIVAGFNATYLNNLFNAIEEDEILFEFKNGESQTQISVQTAHDDRYRAVVMPVRF